MKNKNLVFFVGMPGCGKSTIGKHFSKHTGFKFIDTDDVIIEEQKCTIEEIYAKSGEMGFRALELDLIKRCVELDNTVVCTGGGLPCFNGTMDIMVNAGTVVFINTSPQELWNRVKNTNFSGRPIYQNKTPEQVQETIREKSKERSVFYNKADVTITRDDIILEDLLKAFQDKGIVYTPLNKK